MPRQSSAPTARNVVITGASSGIGKTLALRYAVAGARLGLVGRDRARLHAVADECRQRGAVIETATLDVCARPDMASWIEDFDSRFPIDLVIANAGVMDGTRAGAAIEPADPAYRLMQINVLGVLNTVHPVLPRMMERRHGQIALMSSLAGLIPLRDAPSYAASKAAVLAYGLSLRDLLGGHGIRVNVICPGYVATPMTQQEIGKKPFELSAERAADRILRGLERDKAVIAFPFWYAMATRIGALLPDSWRERVTRASRFQVQARR
ncbi:MAG TPA: SDR family NAD(P)-dependent oxidoreductase [Stellaceae bacterium]|jgi:short-subunit dehydrogenase|nr:SDR family NAD(P)-dependent oxidoreductase [Stellaceae bacterium]